MCVLLLFIVFKLPHLHYPYYWDESWPYASAISEMCNHGISLLPTALPPELSRGHPLFFHCAAATWMKIFGPSHVSMHSFALTISLLTLVSVHEICLRFFGRPAAVISAVLLATLPVFYIQSSFVLCEILVPMLSLLSIYYYTREKYIASAFTLTCLLFTKESGIVALAVIGMDALITLFNKDLPLRSRWVRLASVAVPFLLILSFFILQRIQLGWFFFPLHMERIELKWGTVWYQFRYNALINTFNDQSKALYYVLLLILSIAAAVKTRNVRYAVFLLPAAVLYLLVDDRRGGEINFSWLLLSLLIITVVIMFWVLRSLDNGADRQGQKMIILTGGFVLLYFCFEAVNFYTYRYSLTAFIPMMLLLAIWYGQLIGHIHKALIYPVILLVVGIGWLAYQRNDGHCEVDPEAFNAVDVQQKAVDFVIGHYPADTYISSGSSLLCRHITDPPTGFLGNHPPFLKAHVRWVYDGDTRVAVFDNIEADARYEALKKDPAFHLAYRYQSGKVWTEVYQR